MNEIFLNPFKLKLTIQNMMLSSGVQWERRADKQDRRAHDDWTSGWMGGVAACEDLLQVPTHHFPKASFVTLIVWFKNL